MPNFRYDSNADPANHTAIVTFTRLRDGQRLTVPIGGVVDVDPVDVAIFASRGLTFVPSSDPPTSSLGPSDYVTQAQLASRIISVAHGAAADTPRPTTTGTVQWVGSVQPTYSVNGDTWIDTSS